MAKTKKPVKKQYDCDDVEAYLDRAIEKVKGEIIPRLEILDIRDKEQYDTAKKTIEASFGIIEARALDVQKKVEVMDKNMHEVFSSRKTMTKQLMDGFDSIEKKLDAHIQDETGEFQEIRAGLTKAATHVETIQNTLDNVSANGNKGLSNSLADMYNKLHELQNVTQGARARAKFYTVLHDVVVTTPFLKPLKHKWGVIVYLAIFILLLNTVLHAFGVQWDLISLFRWLFTFGKGN